MSEEEIVSKIKEIIDCLKDDDIKLYAGTDDKALQGLLDLYYKQKEENKSLKSQLDFIGEQNKYIDRLERENKILKDSSNFYNKIKDLLEE